MASDVAVTVADGERVIHDGKVLDAGESFTLPPEAAAALVDTGSATKGGSAKANSGDAAGDAPTGKADDLIAAIPEYTDEQLAALLAAEQDASKPRKSVIEAVEAEQADRVGD